MICIKSMNYIKDTIIIGVIYPDLFMNTKHEINDKQMLVYCYLWRKNEFYTICKNICNYLL